MLSFNGLLAQVSIQVDSVKHYIKDNFNNDSLVAQGYLSLGDIYKDKDELDISYENYRKAHLHTLRTKNYKHIPEQILTIEKRYESIFRFEKALLAAMDRFKIYHSIKDYDNLARSFNTIGYYHNRMGRLEKAIHYHNLSLRSYEIMKDTSGQLISLGNLAGIYQAQNEIEMSLKTHKRCLELALNIKDEVQTCVAYNNIAGILSNQGDMEGAINYYEKAHKLSQEFENKSMEATFAHNLGWVYLNDGDTILGEQYLNKGLEIRVSVNDLYGQIYSLTNLGVLNNKLGKSRLGLQQLEQAYEMAVNSQSPQLIMGTSRSLYKRYEDERKDKQALMLYKKYIQMRDSINNEKTQRAAIRQQTQYEFEKEQIRKENEAKEKARIEAEELKRRNNLEYSLIFLGILALFGIVLMLGFFKVSNNVAEGLIFFAFLIFFEFLLVFTEPYLEQYTQGEPVYALLANSALALIIFPLHAVLERLLKKRIVK